MPGIDVPAGFREGLEAFMLQRQKTIPGIREELHSIPVVVDLETYQAAL